MMISNLLYKIIYNFYPVKKKTILFCSFYGQYNDNPKYICDEFIKKYNDYRIYWVISEKSNEVLPENYIKIYPFSREYYKLINTAEIVVDNYLGLKSKTVNKKSFLYKVLFNKKKNQICISTSHGTALKATGVIGKAFFILNTDTIILGNALIKKQIEKYFKLENINSEICGSPRNDILLNNDLKDIKYLKNKLQIPLNKKIALYAPTFRTKEENFGIDIIKNFKYENVLKILNDKFGGDWLFVIRVHHVLLNSQNIIDYIISNNKSVINGNIGDDMSEYLCCSDLLITDYSSCIFDYIITGKPCFLYVPDINIYEYYFGKMLFDLNELPFLYGTNLDELAKNISIFDIIHYRDDIKKFMIKYGYNENGTASKKVIEIIGRYLLKNDT